MAAKGKGKGRGTHRRHRSKKVTHKRAGKPVNIASDLLLVTAIAEELGGTAGGFSPADIAKTVVENLMAGDVGNAARIAQGLPASLLGNAPAAAGPALAAVIVKKGSQMLGTARMFNFKVGRFRIRPLG